jgi:hypothetical protein
MSNRRELKKERSRLIYYELKSLIVSFALNGERSEEGKITAEVAQGSPLSHLLFPMLFIL